MREAHWELALEALVASAKTGPAPFLAEVETTASSGPSVRLPQAHPQRPRAQLLHAQSAHALVCQGHLRHSSALHDLPWFPPLLLVPAGGLCSCRASRPGQQTEQQQQQGREQPAVAGAAAQACAPVLAVAAMASTMPLHELLHVLPGVPGRTSAGRHLWLHLLLLQCAHRAQGFLRSP